MAVSVTGGEKLKVYFATLCKQKGRVDIGVLAGATTSSIRQYHIKSQASKASHPVKPIAMAIVAATMEYGLPEKNIPPRPFMQQTRDKNLTKWMRIFGTMAEDQGLLPDIKSTLIKIGEIARFDMKQEMITGNFKPNLPATEFRKGFNKPLIDFSDLQRSIDFEVHV